MDSSDDMIHIESRGWLKRGDAQKLGLIGAAATPTPNYEKCPLRPCPTEDACMNAGKCLNPNPSFDQLTRDRFSGEMNRPDPSVATEREARDCKYEQYVDRQQEILYFKDTYDQGWTDGAAWQASSQGIADELEKVKQVLQLSVECERLQAERIRKLEQELATMRETQGQIKAYEEDLTEYEGQLAASMPSEQGKELRKSQVIEKAI